MRPGRGRARHELPWVLAAFVALAAARAGAHGPTVEVAFSQLRPKLLMIAAGDTVHFRPAGGSPISLTVVSDDGQLESPTLGAAGWHHTFETPGDFGFHLKENSASRVRILVGEPRPADPEQAEPDHAGHDH